MISSWHPQQWRYALGAYGHLPITFLRRVVLRRDDYWRQYFWSRWGYVPQGVLDAVRGRPVVWIDAISGGEVTQSVTFCRLLHEALPDYRLVLSTNNRYSHEFASSTLAVDGVIDSPWDLHGPVRRALAAVAPAAVVAVENLTSPILFREARRRGVTTVLVSGLMSKNFHRHKMMQRTTELCAFGDVEWIGAKSEENASGFVAMGAARERVAVTGNMKFDLDYLSVSDAERARLRETLHLAPDEPVLLAASLHPGEEELVGEAYLEARRAVNGLRLVLVPRYQFDVEGMIEKLNGLGLACVRKTSLTRQPAGPDHVIVVDTFGELNRLYAIASVVFLGGSTYVRNVLGLGQNPIEPLAHRRPLFFGPVMNLWREITEELKAAWSGVEIGSAKELATGIVTVLEDPCLTRRITERIERILAPHGKDVSRNVDLVLRALSRANKQSPVTHA